MAGINSQFRILEASLILSSPSAEDTVIEISENILELQFFENILKPYVDGRMAVLDDFGLRTSIGSTGTERIRFVIASGVDLDTPVIEKIFFFQEIVDSKKQGERSEILQINLVEEHVYINAIKSFSKSYTGKLEDIATDILSNQTGKTVSPVFYEPSVQEERKIIIPYMSPLEAVQWIITRATTRTGSPLYLYGSLYTNAVLLSDLDSMLKEEVINSKLPARYSSAIGGIDDTQETLRSYFEVLSVREIGSDNALLMYEVGAIGSDYASLDANNGNYQVTHLSIRNTLDEFYSNEILNKNTTQSVFDPSLEIDGKLSDEYNSTHIHQIVSTGTYNQYKSYHDETQLVDANNNIVDSRLKAKNKITRHLMKKNVIDINAMFIGSSPPLSVNFSNLKIVSLPHNLSTITSEA